MASKDRIAIDVENLKDKLEAYGKGSVGWSALSWAAKVRVVLSNALDPPSEDSTPQTEEQCEQLKQYIRLLLDLRQRRGVSFTEIALYMGEEISTVQLENLYKELLECRNEKTLTKTPKP